MESDNWKLLECATKSEVVNQLGELEKKYNILDWQFSSDRFRLCVLVRVEKKEEI